jgi:putative ABC transport system substrate-binding protein
MAAKRMQLVKEVLPNVSRVAFLRNLGNASNTLILDELRVAAHTSSVQVIAVDVRSASDFDSAFAGMMQQNPDALMLTNDPLQQLNMPKIIDFLARNKVPGIFKARENVVAGGLISYGANLPELFRRAAGYAHKILTGTKHADLPIEQPTKFELVINLKTAKALGLDIPPTLLARADEVIE